MSDVTQIETTLFIRGVKDCMHLICQQCPFGVPERCTTRHVSPQSCTGGWSMACGLAVSTKLNRMMRDLIMPSLATLVNKAEKEKK